MKSTKHAKPALGRRSRWAMGAAVAALAATAAVTATAMGSEGTPGQAPAASDTHAVNEATYDLGAQAFVPGAPYHGKSELAAVVHYPDDLASGKHPLIVMQHGYWDTCADAKAESRLKKAQAALAEAQKAGDSAEEARQQKIVEKEASRLFAWPCPAGIKALPSSSGYDYLAKDLARQGFVVVSMGANGINATSDGQAESVYQARAALINKHLKLWSRLAAGSGPLMGKIKDARNGRTIGAEFQGHVDLKRVGTLGHSMGGGGAMQQISDKRHGDWPSGVDVKATMALAPTATWDNEPVTEVPFAVMWGTCDAVNTGGYFDWNKKQNKAPIYKVTLTGGNHDYFNTQWSPQSGQVAAKNDAIPGKQPGSCLSQDGKNQEQRQLDEAAQRRIAATYTTAFFRHYLLDDKSSDALLTGKKQLAHTVVESAKPH
ncbi:alpha/beta hydrolase [Streptomyces sp. NPDC127074]|uniref:alpha/beta hydrolase n=1 Tax=Streptomyces sp. NPDC127074 TaxID=3347130 RepID=UPI003650625C